MPAKLCLLTYASDHVDADGIICRDLDSDVRAGMAQRADSGR